MPSELVILSYEFVYIFGDGGLTSIGLKSAWGTKVDIKHKTIFSRGTNIDNNLVIGWLTSTWATGSCIGATYSGMGGIDWPSLGEIENRFT